jgi:hypothetical protein
LQGGREITKSFKLTPAVRFSDNAVVDADAYTAENTEDSDEIAGRITAIDGRIKLLKEQLSGKLTEFERNYPRARDCVRNGLAWTRGVSFTSCCRKALNFNSERCILWENIFLCQVPVVLQN